MVKVKVRKNGLSTFAVFSTWEAGLEITGSQQIIDIDAQRFTDKATQAIIAIGLAIKSVDKPTIFLTENRDVLLMWINCKMTTELQKKLLRKLAALIREGKHFLTFGE